MEQATRIISAYLYGAIVLLLASLAIVFYLRGKSQHLRNPLERRELAYRPKRLAHGVLFGKKFGLIAYSPEPDEGHILVLGPTGTGKTSALLIPTLRSWQGTALVVDISGDIASHVDMPNKIVFEPTSDNCIPYDVFFSIDEAPDQTEKQERLEQLAYLLLPNKANDSEAGVFFTANGRKMLSAALICYYAIGWDFVAICEHFLSHDWRSLLNDIAKQENKTANMYISSFVGASEKNTAGCKQAAEAMRYRAQVCPGFDTYFSFLYARHFVICEWRNNELVCVDMIPVDRSPLFVKLLDLADSWGTRGYLK